MNDKYFGSHELHAREEVIKTSSDRSFGLVFAVFFAVLGALSLYNEGDRWPWWFGAGALFALVAMVVPRLLAPLNYAWGKFGLLLHSIVSPLVLGLLFFFCITPIGRMMLLTGKDPLRRRFEPDAESYWIRRDPPGPAPDTFVNQF